MTEKMPDYYSIALQELSADLSSEMLLF